MTGSDARSRRRGPRQAGDFLLHPATLASLVLWAVNDHILKYELTSWWTGKLSDIASLVVFPLLPTAAFELLRTRLGRPASSNRTLLFWCAATGFVMATINIFDGAAWTYEWGLGLAQTPFRSLMAGHWVEVHPVHLTMDATDLITLPAVGIAGWLGWRGTPQQPQTALLTSSV